ncbi:MAG TPA: phosphatase PAP2 family protein [Mycobacteriales bacterium]|nr:phosphatase PAP2 family protein [Mycobacteriales bacterium]
MPRGNVMSRARRVLIGSGRDARPALLGQLLVIGLFLGFYDALRNLAATRVGTAEAAARAVLSAERWLHLDVERPLNSWLAGHPALGLLAGDWYDTAHFFVTLPLLFFVWWRAAPPVYRRLRDVLLLTNVIGFVVYLAVPLAPPRLLPGHGYVDIVATRHALGGWSATLTSAADQYGAMPSLHVGWALWCTLVVFTLTKRAALRTAAVAYPLLTTVVILATGNHWLLDAAAGAACLALGAVGAALLARRAELRVAAAAPRRRVLILSASMGAGHDGAAREMARRLELTGHEVAIRDYLPTVPFKLGYFIRWFYEMQLEHAPATYEWHYAKMRTSRITMVLTTWYAGLAKWRVLRMVRRLHADVVVSTYPLASQVLGMLRALGRLPIPTATFVTDFSVHPAIVSKHVDVNLCITPAAARESTRLCGRPSVATGPLIPDAFREPMSADERVAVRAELGLPVSGVVALVVAGSWGVGNVRATVERLAGDGSITPLVVCGRNEVMRAELDALPGVVALGWRSDMPRLLRACDVVVENAGGLTAMEAMAAGIPVVSHETIPGHGGHNAEEMEAAGVTSWVRDSDQLVPTVHALASGRAGQKQREAALGLFVADAAVVIAELARSRDLGSALATAGLVTPPGARLAAPSPVLRTRRRVVVGGTAVAAAFFTGTTGVAIATDHGLGVTTAHRHPGNVYVVVRLTDDDLRQPGIAALLRSVQGTGAVDREVVRTDPARVRSLAAAGVPLANAGCGRRGWIVPDRAHQDLVDERTALAQVTGTKQWVFVASRKLSVVDLGTALVADDRIVRPDEVVPAGTAVPVLGRNGVVLLVDGRAASASVLATTLRHVVRQVSAEGLELRPLTEIAPRPA